MKTITHRTAGVAVLLVLAAILCGQAFAGQTILYSFGGTNDGKGPYGGLIKLNGNFYGTTSAGGLYNEGTVYEMVPNGDGTYTKYVIYKFTGGNDGAEATGALSTDGTRLFGTTVGNGFTSYGSVFYLEKVSGVWTISYYTFSYPSELEPGPGILIGADGNLYGTTYGGGGTYYSLGEVFQLIPPYNNGGSWTLNRLYAFQGGTDGSNPMGALITDGTNLYGVTSGDYNSICSPVCNYGTVFMITNSTGTWVETPIYNFTGGTDGLGPWTGLTFDSSGNLYGVTEYGGNLSCTFSTVASGCGVVFELTNSGGTWTESVLHAFAGGSEGSGPGGPLYVGPNNIYGITGQGVGYLGEDGYGTIFKIPVGGGTMTTLFSFNSTDGSQPIGSLLRISNVLYGVTAFGGPYNKGTVYSFQ